MDRRRWIGLVAVLFLVLTGVGYSEEAVKCLLVGKEPHGDAGVLNDAVAYINENFPTVHITAVEKTELEALRIDNLKQYDVLMLEQVQVEKGNPPDFVKEGIVQFLQGGGGLVVSHFAVANMQEWRDSIHLLSAMWVSGKSTHGPYHEFRVDIKDEGHPIVEGVKPFTTTDELYYNLLMRPDVHVIATANEELFGCTIAEPMLLTYYVYNARCVYFALGHDANSCLLPEFRKIVAQSIEWAACRR